MFIVVELFSPDTPILQVWGSASRAQLPLMTDIAGVISVPVKMFSSSKRFLDCKGKHPKSGGARMEITYWHHAEGGRFRRLMPASDLPARTIQRAVVLLLYRTYLWNKQQVMSINLAIWSTMQYHVVVDHVVFYVIHSQVRYNSILLTYGSCLPVHRPPILSKHPTSSHVVLCSWQ